MKIRKIKWQDHPILGSLMLDLTTRGGGSPYNTIIFAGENGTGKSTILDSLSTFLNLGSFSHFEYIEYEIGGDIYKAKPPGAGNITLGFFDLEDPSGKVTQIKSNLNNNRQQIESNTKDIRHYGCVLSRARSDYKTNKIKSISTSKLDEKRYDTDSNDDFTSLKQLIVDIDNQDNSEYAELNKGLGEKPKSWEDFYPDSKLFRFKSSFDAFFDKLTFEKVADANDEKAILFSKNGKSIHIDDLSTGEKQIVFRGAYLLKNSSLLSSASIMIDEPELSMHPKWQRKILQYYKGLFTHSGTGLTAQLFFATHSDHVLKEALSNISDNLVITLEDISGNIQPRKIDCPSVLPSITSAETSYLAFDLVSNDYHIELYGYLQDKESKNTVKSCDDFIRQQSAYDSSIHAKPSSFGSTNYETLPTYVRNAIHHPDSGKTFTESELRQSIELLIALC